MEISRKELETLIVQRAWKDDAFRREFLADAKATIEKYSGHKLPAEAKIVAHAEDDTTVHFVIPPKPANTDELSDEDLEKVAGGFDFATGLFLAGMGVAIATGVSMGIANDATRANHGW